MLMHLSLNRLYQLGMQLNLVNYIINVYSNFYINHYFLDRKIFLLGIIQALFEASMYVFVLEWTPVLTQASPKQDIDKMDNTNPPIPHGSHYRV